MLAPTRTLCLRPAILDPARLPVPLEERCRARPRATHSCIAKGVPAVPDVPTLSRKVGYDEVHNDVRDNSNDPDWRPSRKNLLKRDPYLGNGEPDVLLVF